MSTIGHDDQSLINVYRNARYSEFGKGLRQGQVPMVWLMSTLQQDDLGLVNVYRTEDDLSLVNVYRTAR